MSVTVTVPEPRPGKQFLLLELDHELVQRCERAFPDGRIETELVARVERTMRQYLDSAPVDIWLR